MAAPSSSVSHRVPFHTIHLFHSGMKWIFFPCRLTNRRAFPRSVWKSFSAPLDPGELRVLSGTNLFGCTCIVIAIPCSKVCIGCGTRGRSVTLRPVQVSCFPPRNLVCNQTTLGPRWEARMSNSKRCRSASSLGLYARRNFTSAHLALSYARCDLEYFEGPLAGIIPLYSASHMIATTAPR